MRLSLSCSTTARRARNCSSSTFRPSRSRSSCKAAASIKSDNDQVVVVGAGLSGLSCAVTLHKAGIPVSVLEASDAIGGRVRTDELDGFLLDRGFQIFLTAYPEAQKLLDYEKLDLKPFYAGAMVFCDGEFHRVSDPFRHPVDGVLCLGNPVGTIVDKLRVGLVRLRLLGKSVGDIFEAPEVDIEQALQDEGFTSSMIDRFFRPFMGGIFFDRSLGTSSRLFEFVMKMLAVGDNCLPAGGIGSLSLNLAEQLPPDCVKTGARVLKCVGSSASSAAYVHLEKGEVVEASRGVVVAVEGPEALSLLGDSIKKCPSKTEEGVGTCCLYFSAPAAAAAFSNVLYLNGESTGVVNNCCFPSAVSRSYSPPGKTLVSASTVGTLSELSDQDLELSVRNHLSQWFGSGSVDSWQHLKTYRIPYAQPNQAPPTEFNRPVSLGTDIYVCGDHRDTATFDGAIKSGRRTAETILGGI